ncbi:MAG TPA: DUF2334 domain-containing protein, partial [Candidatus Paenibacillus intestinavium]|nr:DUF2334 domain-containing protein [Candidatus Paenibacillus intestinavium]
MKGLVLRIVFLVIAISVLWTSQAVYAEQEKENVLLIYDSYAIGTSKEGNIDSLKRLLGGLGVNVTVVDSESYKKGDVDDFSYVILLRNQSAQTNGVDVLMHDMKQYKGKYLHIGTNPSEKLVNALQLKVQSKLSTTFNITIDGFNDSVLLSKDDVIITSFSDTIHTYGIVESELNGIHTPFGLNDGKYAYLSFYNNSDITEWATGYILKDWLNIIDQGKLYVMLTEVYPFSDFDKLREVSDTLYESGIPFLISSKPIFSNFDYPAARRYAETLKYLQSRNGTIIVDAPAVSYTISADLSVLRGNIASYIDFLASHEVAPLGATAEMYWFQDEYYMSEGLRFYDSTIMLPNIKVMSNQPTNTITTFESSLYSISLDKWREYASPKQLISDLPLNIVLTLNIEDLEGIDDQLKWLSGAWYQFHDYKSSAHRVATEQNVITSSQGILQINDTVV